MRTDTQQNEHYIKHSLYQNLYLYSSRGIYVYSLSVDIFFAMKPNANESAIHWRGKDTECDSITD